MRLKRDYAIYHINVSATWNPNDGENEFAPR